jgi:hypothetical protein
MAFPGFLAFYLDIPFDAILFRLFCIHHSDRMFEQIHPEYNIRYSR